MTTQIDVTALTDSELAIVTSDRYIAWVHAIGTPHVDYVKTRWLEADEEWTTRARQIQEMSA